MEAENRQLKQNLEEDTAWRIDDQNELLKLIFTGTLKRAPLNLDNIIVDHRMIIQNLFKRPPHKDGTALTVEGLTLNIVAVANKAMEFLNLDKEGATLWLVTPTAIFLGKKPIELIISGRGKIVQDTLDDIFK